MHVEYLHQLLPEYTLRTATEKALDCQQHFALLCKRFSGEHTKSVGIYLIFLSDISNQQEMVPVNTLPNLMCKNVEVSENQPTQHTTHPFTKGFHEEKPLQSLRYRSSTPTPS